MRSKSVERGASSCVHTMWEVDQETADKDTLDAGVSMQNQDCGVSLIVLAGHVPRTIGLMRLGIVSD